MIESLFVYRVKSNLHCTRGNTPKPVTSGEATRKRRNGGEPLATLPIRPIRESSLSPPAPLARALATELTAGYRISLSQFLHFC